MSTDLTTAEKAAGEMFRSELARLRNDWWYFLLMGILFLIGGTAAIAYPLYTSFGFVIFVGALLIISGVVMIVSAFWAGKWSAFTVQILVGMLYSVAGFIVTEAPAEALVVLTLMLAGFFVVAGAFRIITALVDKYPMWGWSLLNGIVTLMLGLIIFRSFRSLPEGEGGVFWIIGLLVGMDLLFNGWTWIMLALGLRNLPEPEATST